MADTSHNPLGTNKDGVVIDEMLCFVVNKLDILPPASIVDLCLSTYSDTEIEASKRVLFDLCADENSTRYRRRQGPQKNTNNVEDVIRLLQEKGMSVPVFVVRDLSRLPPITFDSIDVSTLLHNIRRTQLEVDQLKLCLGSQRDATDGLTAAVSTVDTRLAVVEATRNPAPAGAAVLVQPECPMAMPSDTNDVNEDDEQTYVKQLATDTDVTAALDCMEWPTPGENANLQVRPALAPLQAATLQQPAAAVQSSSTVLPSADPSTSAPSTGPLSWTTVARRRATTQPNKRTRAANTNKTQKSITGSARGSGFNSTRRKRFASVFATRFEPHVTDSDISVYLTNRLAVKVDVTALATKHDTYASFHVTCECEDPSIFMDPTLWPENIFVRWWRTPRNGSSSSGTRRMSLSEATSLL